MKISTKSLGVLGLICLLAFGAVSNAYGDGRTRVFKKDFDVTQDGNTFKVVAFENEFPPFDTFDSFINAMGELETHPGQGATFSVLVFIYPAGTLQGGTVSGTDGDGNPAFPDMVLGTWSCRGWFVLSGVPGTTGIQLIGTQVWIFDSHSDVPGGMTIVTDGIDLSIEDVDLNVSFKRAITGGTGYFAGAKGEQTMTNFGFNDSFGFDSTHNLKFSTHAFKFRKNDRDGDSDSDSD